MRIFRRSPFSGRINVMDVDVTDEQWQRYTTHGMLIQDALPHLSASEREFLISGTTPEEWEKYMKTEEDE